MKDAIGLLLFVVYIAVVIGVAAGITAVVVRLSPAKKPSGTSS